MASRVDVLVPSLKGSPAPSRGLDRRALQSFSDTSSVWEAVNCDLTTSGGFRRRDALIEYAELPPGTIGLYALADKLHVAVPAGSGRQQSLPNTIHGDVFGDSDTAATSLTGYVRMTAQSSWGGAQSVGALPYLVLESAAGQYVHHWIRALPLLPTSPVDTRISTGFEPGPDLAKIKQKFYAPDRTKAVVRYSSTEFGPAVWDEVTAPDDAGFIATIEHALSSPDVTGLTVHQGRLVIVFANSMQFWNVDPDPQLNSLAFVLNGPGTKVFGSLSPVTGDVFYFSEGGFRSLQTQTTTGELREGDIGASLADLAAQFAQVDPSRVKSLWSQARSQYLCFVSEEESGSDGTTTVFAFTLSQTFGVVGWTTWQLPVNVEYVTELDGVLYVRSGDMIYKFDADGLKDEVDGAQRTIDAYFETQFLDGGFPQFRKQWLMMDVLQDTTSVIDVSVLVDRSNREIREIVAKNLTGPTYSGGTIPVDVGETAVAFRIAFKSKGTVQQMTLSAVVTAGSR